MPERLRMLAADERRVHFAQELQPLNVDVLAVRDDLRPVIECCLESGPSVDQSKREILRHAFDSTLITDDVYEVLAALSHLLSMSNTPNQTWISIAWRYLADLSKQRRSWRPLFGPLTRVGSQYRFRQGSGESAGCILEAAVLAMVQAVNDSLPAGAVRPLLRLIANCCADNNINRNLIINSSAIHWLQDLVKKGTEIDVLLPTLYNVCVDYDEPAINPKGQSYRLFEQMTDTGVADDDSMLSQAEARLQMWRLLEVDKKHFERSGAILADLLELSSRSALFDISIILGNDESEDSTRHLEQGSILLNLLLSKGTLIASTFAEAQASICQTCMNLFSQPIMQRVLAKSHHGIQLFIELPYLTVAEEDEEVDLSPYREAFLKIIYTISALPEYTTGSSPDSILMEALTQQHLARYDALHGLEDPLFDHTPSQDLSRRAAPPTDDPSSIASVLVLINNALSDRTRIDAFLKLHENVCKHIMLILLHADEEPILLPALKLTTRLALSPLGVHNLYSADVDFSVLSRLLAINSPTAKPPQSTGPQPKHNLAIQQEFIILARLINKSQPGITAQFGLSDSFPKLLSHSTTTIDTSSKLETSRLCVEILRNLASRDCSASDANVISLCLTSPTMLPNFITSLTFLLSNAPTPSAQSEALFGLGMFSSLFISPSSAHYDASDRRTLLESLGQGKDKILEVFKKVAATEGQGNSKADYENLKVFLTHMLLPSEIGRTDVSPQREENAPEDSSTSALLEEFETIAKDMGVVFNT